MKVVAVKLKNIRSYRNQEIFIPPDGITVFYGDTGAGKTTILSSITWAIFGDERKSATGDPTQRYGKPVAADLLRTWEGEGEVTVAFLSKDNEGDYYVVITRKIRKEGDKVRDKGGTIKVIRKGRPPIIRRESSEALTKLALHFLGIPKPRKGSASRLFLSAIMIPQFGVNEIVGDRDKVREAVDTALNLDRYRNIRKNAEDVWEHFRPTYNDVRRKVEERKRVLKGKDLNAMEKLRQELEEELRKATEGLNRIRGELDTTLKKKSELDRRREVLRRSIESLSATVASLRKEKEMGERLRRELTEIAESVGVKTPEELVELGDALENELSRIRENTEEVENRLEKVQAELTEAVARESALRKELKTLELSIKDAEKKIEDKRKILSQGYCPTCLREISREQVEEILNKMKNDFDLPNLERRKTNLLTEIEEAVKNRESLEKEKTRLYEERKRLKLKEKELQSRLSKINSVLRSVEELKRIEKTVQELPGKESELQKLKHEYADLLNKIQNLEEGIRQLNESLYGLTGKKSRLESEIKNLSKEIEEIRGLKKLLEEAERELEEAELLRKLIAGKTSVMVRLADVVEDTVRKEAASFLRTLFSIYHAILAQGQEDTDAEIEDDLTLRFIKNISGRKTEITQPSGGEITAISLAYRLALNAVARRMIPQLKDSMVIMDEPTIGFSPERVERLRALLKDEKFHIPQTIIVTHDRGLMEVADCRIRLERNPATNTTLLQYEECHQDPEYLKKILRPLLKGMFPSQTTGIEEGVEETLTVEVKEDKPKKPSAKGGLLGYLKKN